MKLLLDTCTFLWWIRGGSEITGRVVDVVRVGENEVYLSARRPGKSRSNTVEDG